MRPRPSSTRSRSGSRSGSSPSPSPRRRSRSRRRTGRRSAGSSRGSSRTPAPRSGDAIATSLDLAPTDGDDETATAEDDEGRPLFAILLLSDGASTTGISTDEAVELAQEAGVAIYTVALGTDEGTVEVPNEFGELQTVDVAPDRETLREIAEDTGGRYFDAPTEEDLKAVYEEIGSQLAFDEEKREVTVAFAAGGAVFLLLSSALSALWFGRIP